MIFILPFIGAFLSRWHGGGFFYAPKFIKTALWSVPFAVLSMVSVAPHVSTVVMIEVMLSVFTACFAAKATGHGQYMSLGTVWGYMDAEFVDPIVRLFFGRDPRTMDGMKDRGNVYRRPRYNKLYWRCVFGLFVLGLLSVAAPSMVVGYINIADGAIIALCGALGKPVAYMIGWLLDRKDKLDKLPAVLNHGTAIGELLTGFFTYLCFVAVLW